MQLQIPVSKGASSVLIETDDIPQEVYAAALAEGLKSFVNKGMAKIKVTDLSEKELASARAAANKVAKENRDELLKQEEYVNAEGETKSRYTGKLKLPGVKARGATKVSGAVNTEAMRIARGMVKAEMTRHGIKSSHVEAKEITKCAKDLLEINPGILETARVNLERREAIPVSIDVTKITVSDKLVKAAEAANAKKKAEKQLSAAQAGKTKVRQRPQAQA